MKLVNVGKARATFASLVKHAQGETVVIVRYGQPVATLQGTRDADPGLWREIERRCRAGGAR